MDSTNRFKFEILINLIILKFIMIVCIYKVHLNNPHQKSIFKTIQITTQLIISSLIFFIICIFLLKIKLLIREIYFNEETRSNLASIMKSLNFNSLSWIVIGITFFSFMIIINNPDYELQSLYLYTGGIFFASIFSLFLLYSVKIFECRVLLVEKIFNSGGLDPGTAMACSYFFGYLKIMLPSSGGIERAGILAGIEQYEAAQNITIPVKKLFVLIPSSCYISPDLKEISDNRLESRGNLETVVLDRAGVKSRTYHNTVYKIYHKESRRQPDSYISLVVEGATPLKTFLETRARSSHYGPLYKDFNFEIIKNFYLTLKNLLDENPDCKNYCELIYYDDESSNINIADILIERVKIILQ